MMGTPSLISYGGFIVEVMENESIADIEIIKSLMHKKESFFFIQLIVLAMLLVK